MKHLRKCLLLLAVVLALCVSTLAVNADTAAYTAADVITYDGLSVRTTQDFAGLRSMYTVDHRAIDDLIAQGAHVQYGALMGVKATPNATASKLVASAADLVVDENGNLLTGDKYASAVLVFDSRDPSRGTGKYTNERADSRSFAFTTTYNYSSQTAAMLKDTVLLYRAFLIVNGQVTYVNASGDFQNGASLFAVCEKIVAQDSYYKTNPAISAAMAKCYAGVSQGIEFSYAGGALVGGIYRVNGVAHYIREGEGYSETGIAMTRISPRIPYEDAFTTHPNDGTYTAYTLSGDGYTTADVASANGAAVYVRKAYTVTYQYENNGGIISEQKVYPGEDAMIPLLYKIPAGYDGASFAETNGVEASDASKNVQEDLTMTAVLGNYINVTFYDYDGVTILSTRKFLTGTDNSAPILDDGRFGCWVERNTNYKVELATLREDCEVQAYIAGNPLANKPIETVVPTYTISANQMKTASETFTLNTSSTADASKIYYTLEAQSATSPNFNSSTKYYYRNGNDWVRAYTAAGQRYYTLKLTVVTDFAAGDYNTYYTYAYTVAADSPIKTVDSDSLIYTPSGTNSAVLYVPNETAKTVTLTVANVEEAGVYRMDLKTNAVPGAYYFRAKNVTPITGTMQTSYTNYFTGIRRTGAADATKLSLLSTETNTTFAYLYLYEGDNQITLCNFHDTKSYAGFAFSRASFTQMATHENGAFVRFNASSSTHNVTSNQKCLSIFCKESAALNFTSTEAFTLQAGSYKVYMYGSSTSANDPCTVTLTSASGTQSVEFSSTYYDGMNPYYGAAILAADTYLSVTQNTTYTQVKGSWSSGNHSCIGFLFEKVEDALPDPGNAPGTDSPKVGPTVRFLDSEGNLLKRTVVGEGATAAEPFVESLDFVGWDSEFKSVTRDMDVRATTFGRVEIEFYDDAGTLLARHIVRKGGSVADLIDVENYDGFFGWVDADGKTVDLVADKDRAFYMGTSASDFTVSASELITATETFTKTTVTGGSAGTLKSNRKIAYYTIIGSIATEIRSDTKYYKKIGDNYTYDRTVTPIANSDFYTLEITPITDTAYTGDAYTFGYTVAENSPIQTKDTALIYTPATVVSKAQICLANAGEGDPETSIAEDKKVAWTVNAPMAGLYRLTFASNEDPRLSYFHVHNMSLNKKTYVGIRHRTADADHNMNKGQLLATKGTMTAYMYLKEGSNELLMYAAFAKAESGACISGIDFELVAEGSAFVNQMADKQSGWGNITASTSVNKELTLDAGSYNVYYFGMINGTISYTLGGVSRAPSAKIVYLSNGASSRSANFGLIDTVTISESGKNSNGTYTFEATFPSSMCVGFVFEKIDAPTVTYKVGENVVKMESVALGSTVVPPAGYTWPEVGAITGDTVITAIPTYTVTFVNPRDPAWVNATATVTNGVLSGKPAQDPVDAQNTGNIFYTWNLQLDEVRGDCTVEPIFVPEGNTVLADPASASDGTSTFQTIQEAYDYAKSLIEGGVKSEMTVLLADARHLLEEKVEITGDQRITFQGMGDATEVTSNVPVPVTSGSKNGNIWSYSVPSTPAFRDIYVEGAQMSIAKSARYKMKVDTCALANSYTYTNGDAVQITDCVLFVPADTIPEAAFDANGNVIGELEYWVQVDWQIQSVHVEGLSDKELTDYTSSDANPQVGLIICEKDWFNLSAGLTAGEKSGSAAYYSNLGNRDFWFANNAALIDEPGEFVYTGGKIYAYLPDGAETVYYPTLETLFEMKHASNLIFKNIRFTGTTTNHITENGYITGQGAYIKDYWNYNKNPNLSEIKDPNAKRYEYVLANGAIYGADVQKIAVTDCHFEYLGGDGVNFRGEVAHGKKTIVDTAVVTNSVFRNIGGSAVRVGNCDDGIVNRNIIIRNNYVEKAGQVYNACVALLVTRVDGLDISYNTILESAYSAISAGWSWGTYSASSTKVSVARATISYNYIEDFMTEMQDGGAIYVLGGNAVNQETADIPYYDYLNTMSHNYVVLTERTGKGSGHWTVYYHDSGASHWHDVGNVLVVDPDATMTDHTYVSYQTGTDPAYNNWTDSFYIIGRVEENHPKNPEPTDAYGDGITYKDTIFDEYEYKEKDGSKTPKYPNNKKTDVHIYDSFADMIGTPSENTVKKTAELAGCDWYHPTYGAWSAK